jgi:lysozyme
MTEPMTPPPKRTAPAKTAAGAAAIAAAVLAVAPFVASKEGTVTHAYRDPVGIATYCTGETQDVDWSRVYTRDECHALLRKRLANDYAPAILNAIPKLAENRHAFAALLDFAYNAGETAAIRSPMAKAFNAGQWVKGCNAFPGYFVTARGVKLRGLVVRREGERLLCLGSV